MAIRMIVCNCKFDVENVPRHINRGFYSIKKKTRLVRVKKCMRRVMWLWCSSKRKWKSGCYVVVGIPVGRLPTSLYIMIAVIIFMMPLICTP